MNFPRWMVQAAVCTAICGGIVIVLPPSSSFLAVINAIIVLEPTTGASIRKSFFRVMGVLIGAILGFIQFEVFDFCAKQLPVNWGKVVMWLGGILIVLPFGLHREYVPEAAMFTLYSTITANLIYFVAFVSGGTSAQQTLLRVFYSAIGVAVSTVVVHVVCPRPAKIVVRNTLSDVLKKIAEGLQFIICPHNMENTYAQKQTPMSLADWRYRVSSKIAQCVHDMNRIPLEAAQSEMTFPWECDPNKLVFAEGGCGDLMKEMWMLIHRTWDVFFTFDRFVYQCVSSKVASPPNGKCCLEVPTSKVCSDNYCNPKRSFYLAEVKWESKNGRCLNSDILLKEVCDRLRDAMHCMADALTERQSLYIARSAISANRLAFQDFIVSTKRACSSQDLLSLGEEMFDRLHGDMETMTLVVKCLMSFNSQLAVWYQELCKVYGMRHDVRGAITLENAMQ